ncbi:hypothetical protein, partial [Pseudoflavonifractor phocaeensis]|uniref:hypothetical protein n=1 Tax=Pseudoflavonifractor phocaeensis TaxID=1870988 RepID=UPI00195C1DB9
MNNIKGCAAKCSVSRHILFADAGADKTAEKTSSVFTSVSVGSSQPHFVGSIEPIIVGNVRANGLKYKMPTT